MSFPRTVGQIPVHYDQLPTGRPKSDPDERWASGFRDVPNSPLYPFGHGESYAEFTYEGIDLSADEIERGESIGVSVEVTNVGDRPGTEVVQCYVRDPVASRSRPVKQLRRFEKRSIDPGESATVRFELTEDDLDCWTADDEWATEPGEFEVMVGRSAEAIEREATFVLCDQ